MGKRELEPVLWAVPEERAQAENEVVDRFHDLYCRSRRQTWRNTHWLGVQLLKCPLDLWVYQELLHRLRPDLIVETGTFHGGSAYFLASICDLIGTGRVVTIDIEAPPAGPGVRSRPDHPRITYLSASSINPATLQAVRDIIEPGDKVMVILDSNHSLGYVRRELRAYAPLVTEGSYLIVEDTNLNAWSDFGPGPLEAVTEFLAEDDRFVVDRSLEKFMMTFNPSGYLLRRGS
jgi:cephalosporin hydroxylase